MTKRPKPKNKITSKKWERYKEKARSCPKCGAGVFLAQHKDRETCGRCGYTEFKIKKQDIKVEAPEKRKLTKQETEAAEIEQLSAEEEAKKAAESIRKEELKKIKEDLQ